MIKSMTGFATLTREDDDSLITVTVKSVNHRYLDLQIRAPQALGGVEVTLRSLVKRHVARGRVDLAVMVRIKAPPRVELDVNESLMAALSKAAAAATASGLAGGALTAGDLLRCPQVVTVRELSTEESTWKGVGQEVMRAVETALVELDEMRRQEGEFLATDLEERATALGVLVDGVVSAAETGEGALRERLLARVAEIETQVDVEPVMVAQEVVRWAARSDIHEEVTRLRGHLDHMRVLSIAAAPCGRKLDFLVQEMNREVNTIGSKAEGRAMAELVVAAKAEIEKLREQIQNVE